MSYNTRCNFGEKCHFNKKGVCKYLHDEEVQPKKVKCKNGHACPYGVKCKFLHDELPTTTGGAAIAAAPKKEINMKDDMQVIQYYSNLINWTVFPGYELLLNGIYTMFERLTAEDPALNISDAAGMMVSMVPMAFGEGTPTPKEFVMSAISWKLIENTDQEIEEEELFDEHLAQLQEDEANMAAACDE